MEKDLLPLALAIYLGTVMQKFLESIVASLVMPLLGLITPAWFYTQKLDVMGAKLDIGDAISNTIMMIVAILVFFVLVRWIIEKGL